MNHDIAQWALRHSVSLAALAELRAIWGDRPSPANFYADETSESAVKARCVLAAPHRGMHLFRNNVGVLKDATGRPVRYGLANDSTARNRVLKSGDLIGIQPTVITVAHVGQTIGQFVSIECKRAGWSYRGDEHEKSQLNWIQLILASGGRAKFVTHESEI